MSTDPLIVESESAANLGLKWENGVGKLPGSDLQFRMNENGDLEMISDEESLGQDLDVGTSSRAASSQQKSEVAKRRASLNSNTSMRAENSSNCIACLTQRASRIHQGRFCSEDCVAKNVCNISQRHETARRLSTEQLLAATAPSDNKQMQHLSEQHGLSLFKMNVSGHVSPARNSCDKVATEKVESQNLAGLKQTKEKFSWKLYMEMNKATPLAEDILTTLHGRSPFPMHPNPFKVGCYVEAVDPDHQSNICLMRVSEVQGYRLRLHFVGDYSCYDIWTNADSPFIFPNGFCKRTGRKLDTAKHFPHEGRDLEPQTPFAEQQEMFGKMFFENLTAFKIGEKLEAVDRKNRDLTCVATVVDIIRDYILIHFDGWHTDYDYWARCDSPLIHPVGWCQSIGRTLAIPPNHRGSFLWSQYLKATKSRAAVADCFSNTYDHRSSIKVGMKLEVVDKRNPLLVRVASIVNVDEHRVNVQYDGWPTDSSTWLDVDSPDIHPPTWCLKTGHLLQPPVDIKDDDTKGCGTPGCGGQGHARTKRENVYRSSHHLQSDCPYGTANVSILPDRLDATQQEQEGGADASVADNATPCAPVVCKSTATSRQKNRKRKRRKQDRAILRTSVETVKFPEPSEPPKATCATEKSLPINPCTQEPFTYRWDLVVQSLPGVDDISINDVIEWDVASVAQFVAKLTGKVECADLLKKEEVDGEALMLLTQEDITHRLNIKLGPALKIFNAALMFRSTCKL